MRDPKISRRMHVCLMTLFTRAEKELPGFPERHAWAQAEVREGSTRRMSYRQMQHCIDQLKFLLGERRRAPLPYWFATPPQIRSIRGLAALVPWREDPQSGLAGFARRELSELRRKAWDGEIQSLSRTEASKVIAGLRGLARYERSKA